MQDRTIPFRAVEIQLENGSFPVTPGSSVVVPFAVINHSGRDDYFDITVSGIPMEWVLLDMPAILIRPGERRESSLTIQAPGNSPISQGSYPVTIRATSQTSPEWWGEGRFDLRVSAYSATQATVPFDVGDRVGVKMDALQFTVSPGESVEIPIVIANRSKVEDNFMMIVEGLPPSWISATAPAIHLMPGEQRQVALVITPPQAPASRAGRHPFHLRIVSQVDPAQVTTVDGVLTVAAVSQFATDLSPQRIDAGRTARLRIHNLSNIQDSFTIHWQTEGDALEFVPSITGPVRVMPGEVAAVDFAASPRNPNWLSGPLTMPYTVLVQSAEGETQAQNGEVVSRSLIPVWALPALLVFCLTAVCGLGFLWNWNQGRLTEARNTAIAQATLFTNQTATTAMLQQTPSIPPILTATVPAPSATAAPSGTAAPLVTLSPTITVLPSLTPITPTFTPITPTSTSTLAPTNTLPPPTNTALPPTATSAPVVIGTVTAVPLPVTGQQSILFASNRSGNPQLYLYNTANGSLNRLTNDAGSDSQPVWSPDGTRVAFTTNRDGNNEIYVMNADGSNPVNLTRNPADDNSPAWSPDGKQISFTTNRDGNNEIYVMNADGSNPVNLTKSPANDSKAAWYTQRGLLTSTSRILFVTDRDGNNEIYAMNPDGTGPTNLTKNPASDLLPAVPFAGGEIAFVSDRDGNQEIYAMGLDGSGPTNLTKNPAADTMPVWSQDGKWIAFVTNRDGNNEVYVMAADGSKQTNLSNNPADDTTPAWK